ncbi:hypothetical protein M8818_006999 [Zalaria obscura]|uniref:Uncharacterized protein n=1 Tax=Zalaria obscura TaxID=2024903 RepID=A0ACC3S3S8_9PEZI
MADPLYDLLTPYLDRPSNSAGSTSTTLQNDQTTSNYLNRLTTLSLSALTTTEPASLAQSNQSVLRSLQALSKRSHRSVISATDHLAQLSSLLPKLSIQTKDLKDGLPGVETAATEFARRYDRNTDNAVLDRRKRAMLLGRNVDRVGDVLDIPTLLSSSISSSSATQGATGAAATGYASALDLHAHVKRLNALYPESGLVKDIAKQADDEIQNLITVLITGLQSQTLKLAGAMRMVGWLRRVAPELANPGYEAHTGRSKDMGSFGKGAGFSEQSTAEGSLGALFLMCRLNTLRRTLDALEPLRDLADQETFRRKAIGSKERWTGGTQTERYLKRYIEVFREQSFAIISMYKSIFPTALPAPGTAIGADEAKLMSPTSQKSDAFEPSTEAAQVEILGSTPSALASFAPRLVDMLADTLSAYMPNVVERASRDSLLTQVLYCAGSLGRLGADFGMMLALLEEDMREEVEEVEEEREEEWVQVMKKHRVQASRLEILASGVAGSRKGSASWEVRSPSAAIPGT